MFMDSKKGESEKTEVRDGQRDEENPLPFESNPYTKGVRAVAGRRGSLRVEALPAWLREIPEINPQPEFSIKQILENSLYYPASGLDGGPVKNLAGLVHSFVYADYFIKEENLLNEVGGRGGFTGYRLLFGRIIKEEEVVPPGWKPKVVPSEIQYELMNGQMKHFYNGKPFGYWGIWQRNEDCPPSHGPERFSLLFLCGEMSAVYQGLYYAHNIVPKILAIIRPGIGFGGAWECVTRDNSFFKRVLDAHPKGLPEVLVWGDNGPQPPPWTDYQRGFYWSGHWGVDNELRISREIEILERVRIK